MKILCFGNPMYKWNLKIFQEIIKIEGVSVSIFTSREYENYDIIGSMSPGLVLFYGWNWIVPKKIVDTFLCLGLHPSPLPKYRGGSPIQNQIIRGEIMGAVSIFKMSSILDKGAICFQEPTSLEGSLEDIHNRIYKTGLKGTIEIIEKTKNGKIDFVPQGNITTFYSRRKPTQSEITLDEIKHKPAGYLYNKIRMLADPYPNAYIKCVDGQKLFITKAHIEEREDEV